MPYRQNTVLTVENKVFKIEHIRELAELLFDEYASKKDSNNQGIEFHVKCFDKTSFSSDDLSLFFDKSPILKKRISSIEMAIHPSKTEFVKIRLTHGSHYDEVEKVYTNDSHIELNSVDSMWLNGFAGKLQEWLDGVPDQINQIEKYSRLILWLGAIAGVFLFGVVVDWFNINKDGYVPYWKNVLTGFDVFAYILVAIILGGAIGLGITSHQVSKSPDIWPIVELQTGPDHLMKEKIKRKYYNTVWTIVILPLILSFISCVLFISIK